MTSVPPVPTPYIVVYLNGSVSAKTAQEISHMIDLSDCDACDGVAGIWAVNNNNNLVKIRIGTLTPYDYTEPDSIIYAAAPVYAGTRVVSYIHYSDH